MPLSRRSARENFLFWLKAAFGRERGLRGRAAWRPVPLRAAQMKKSAQSVDQALTAQPDKLPDPTSRYGILDPVEPLPFRPMDALLLIVVGLAIVAAITIAVVALVVYLVKR